MNHFAAKHRLRRENLVHRSLVRRSRVTKDPTEKLILKI